MRRVFFLLAALCCFAACQSGGSNDSGGSTDWTDLDIKVEKNNNDQRTSEGYIDASGRKQGPMVTYHPRKGLVKSITYYIDGVKNGPYIEMTESGSVKEKSWFDNDQLQGERIVFNRTRVKEESFFVDNVLHGKRSLYYDNGKIQEEGNFVNGKRDGVVRWYNQDEEITIQTEYSNGEIVKQIPIEK